MKRILMLISVIPQLAWPQYHFEFEDDSLTWEGTVPHWKMEQVPGDRWECSKEDPIEGYSSLHHAFDSPGAGCDYILITHDPVIPGDSLSLSFLVRHGYPPSSANNWQVAMLADFEKPSLDSQEDASGQNPGQITGGIILGVNFRGSDDLVRLWRSREGLVEELYCSSINYQEEAGTGSSPQFRLVWSPQGELSVYYSADPHHVPLVKIGSCQPGGAPTGKITGDPL